MKLYALDNERCFKPSCHKTHGYDDNGYCRHLNVAEPTDLICLTHRCYAGEWVEGKEECNEAGYLDAAGKKNPCQVVDVTRTGEAREKEPPDWLARAGVPAEGLSEESREHVAVVRSERDELYELGYEGDW